MTEAVLPSSMTNEFLQKYQMTRDAFYKILCLIEGDKVFTEQQQGGSKHQWHIR
jgi:hypothetical protein